MRDVTCVVNAHREGHLIHPTLKSVKMACRRAMTAGIRTRVIVVLDDPDGPTVEVVEQDAEPHWRIETVAYGDLANSRNHAIGLADTEFAAFLDGDDLWGPSWLTDACVLAFLDSSLAVYHPEYNVYFGSSHDHVFRHVDSTSPRFVFEALNRENYWTALSLARTELYRNFPYTPNTIRDGFGYEDWTWNVQTLRAGVDHRVVPQSAHYIRRGKRRPSLLDSTNAERAVPRVLPLYRRASPDMPSSSSARKHRTSAEEGEAGRNANVELHLVGRAA